MTPVVGVDISFILRFGPQSLRGMVLTDSLQYREAQLQPTIALCTCVRFEALTKVSKPLQFYAGNTMIL